MALAFGITPETAITTACGYVGWYTVGSMKDSYVGGGGIVGMIARAWDTMSQPYSFEFTRNWIDSQSGWWYYKKPDPDMPHPKYIGEYIVAPFYNWRFWGNAYVPLF